MLTTDRGGREASVPRIAIAAMTAIAILSATACDHPKSAAPRRPQGLQSTTGDKSPTIEGPWDNEHWGATTLPAAAFLHDTGTVLETVDTLGVKSPVWKHPSAEVTNLTVSYDRRRVAAVVSLPNSDKTGVFNLLYLLDADGRVLQVDQGRSPQTLASPLFLRGPSNADTVERLYWIQQGGKSDPLESGVFAWDSGSIKRVTLPLRDLEWPTDIAGWPGSRTFSLRLSLHFGEPDNAEILGSNDYLRVNNVSSFERWSAFGHRAFTSSPFPPVWLTPIDYVVPVLELHAQHVYALQRFQVGCEGRGVRAPVSVDASVDDGSTDASWLPLRLDDDHILVLSRELASRAASDADASGVYLSLDTRNGRVQPSRVIWTRGPWTSISDGRTFEGGLEPAKCQSP